MEQEAFQLAKYYIRKKKTFKFPPIYKIKKTKYWKYFIQTAYNFSTYKEWDIYKFIDSLFEAYEDVWPAQLPTQKAWDIYLDYKHRYEGNIKKDLILELLLTYKSIKDYCNKHNDGIIDYKKYLIEQKDKIIRGNINPLFLLFCKEFYEILSEDEIHKIFPQNILDKKNSIVYNKKIYNTLKKVLGESYV